MQATNQYKQQPHSERKTLWQNG